MEINLWAVLLATVGQFAFGMFWYMPVFGNLWGKMHGFDKLSKTQQKEMASKMGPIYGLQFLVSVFTAFALAKLMVLLPGYSPYTLALLVWFGFVVPIQFSDIAFGGTDQKWLSKKLAVVAFGSLGALFVAVTILGLF